MNLSPPLGGALEPLPGVFFPAMRNHDFSSKHLNFSYFNSVYKYLIISYTCTYDWKVEVTSQLIHVVQSLNFFG